MTESLKGWLDKIPRTYDPAPEDYRSDERLLTAFIREVERRMKKEADAYDGFTKAECIILAWNKVRREFGLETTDAS